MLLRLLRSPLTPFLQDDDPKVFSAMITAMAMLTNNDGGDNHSDGNYNNQ
jgi:hypothetical protein